MQFLRSSSSRHCFSSLSVVFAFALCTTYSKCISEFIVVILLRHCRVYSYWMWFWSMPSLLCNRTHTYHRLISLDRNCSQSSFICKEIRLIFNVIFTVCFHTVLILDSFSKGGLGLKAWNGSTLSTLGIFVACKINDLCSANIVRFIFRQVKKMLASDDPGERCKSRGKWPFVIHVAPLRYCYLRNISMELVVIGNCNVS